MLWLDRATRLNSKTPIMMAIIALLKLKEWPDLHYHRITPELLDKYRIHRASAYRALNLLEDAGLVTVKRNRGESPLVAIIGIDGAQDRDHDDDDEAANNETAN